MRRLVEKLVKTGHSVHDIKKLVKTGHSSSVAKHENACQKQGLRCVPKLKIRILKRLSVKGESELPLETSLAER